MRSRTRTACAGIGALLFFLGVLGIIALIPSWLEIGTWTVVFTWFAIGDAMAVVIGGLLFYLSDTEELP